MGELIKNIEIVGMKWISDLLCMVEIVDQMISSAIELFYLAEISFNPTMPNYAQLCSKSYASKSQSIMLQLVLVNFSMIFETFLKEKMRRKFKDMKI